MAIRSNAIPNRSCEDVLDGKVTVAHARDAYGVVILGIGRTRRVDIDGDAARCAPERQSMAGGIERTVTAVIAKIPRSDLDPVLAGVPRGPLCPL